METLFKFSDHAVGNYPDQSQIFLVWDRMLVPHVFGIDFSMQHLTIVIAENMEWVIWVGC